MGKMINVPEAAERLGLQPPTVYGMISEGTLPAYRFGRAVRVDEDELEAWKQAQRVKLYVDCRSHCFHILCGACAPGGALQSGKV